MITNDRVVYFDVDDTLVLWDVNLCKKYEHECREFQIPNDRGPVTLLPHKGNISDLIKYSESGYTVIVWSLGGGPWAREVVKKLGLDAHVAACLSKPEVYYDDLDFAVWMREASRRYRSHGYDKD